MNKIYHTYTTPKMFGHLLTFGEVWGDLRTIQTEFMNERNTINAYEWMINQMKKRLGPPPCISTYPVWLWHTWEGIPNSYPSVRNLIYERMDNPGGIYRLTLEIPDELVLLSNFDTWHAVLRNKYLSLNLKDLDKKWTKEAIEDSWERIFNIDDISLNRVWGYDTLTIQGTVWKITTDMLIKAEHFPHMKPTKKFLKNKKLMESINSKLK